MGGNDIPYQRCGNNNMRETDKPRHLNKEINMDNILNGEAANNILEKNFFSFLKICITKVTIYKVSL